MIDGEGRERRKGCKVGSFLIHWMTTGAVENVGRLLASSPLNQT